MRWRFQGLEDKYTPFCQTYYAHMTLLSSVFQLGMITCLLNSRCYPNIVTLFEALITNCLRHSETTPKDYGMKVHSRESLHLQ